LLFLLVFLLLYKLFYMGYKDPNTVGKQVVDEPETYQVFL
jgi:hypothetical protein